MGNSNMLRGGVENSDNFSKRTDTKNQSGEMFRTFKNIMSPEITNRTEAFTDSLKNSSIFNPILEGYQKISPLLPELNPGEKNIGYTYEKEVGPGMFNIGGDYDYGNNDYNFDIGYKMGFDEGGIATLPEGNTEEPGMQQPKVPMTDEQKDYLFDYMMDFMMKQKMREQQEMEGKIPRFNYKGLEV